METLTLPFEPQNRLGHLQFRSERASNAVVGSWRGCGRLADPDEFAQQIRRLLATPADRLVLDFEQLDTPNRDLVDVMANGVLAALRFGQSVVLLRCPEELHRQLRYSGVRGKVGHAASLSAATAGCLGSARTWEIHIRSEANQIDRVRRVLAAIARDAGMSEEAELRMQSAAREATLNGITHGSPLGVRNHVRVAVSLEDDAIYIDVMDQGAGFDPYLMLGEGGDVSSEHGMGLRLMRSLAAQCQFYRTDDGMLVRLKHHCD